MDRFCPAQRADTRSSPARSSGSYWPPFSGNRLAQNPIVRTCAQLADPHFRVETTSPSPPVPIPAQRISGHSVGLAAEARAPVESLRPQTQRAHRQGSELSRSNVCKSSQAPTRSVLTDKVLNPIKKPCTSRIAPPPHPALRTARCVLRKWPEPAAALAGNGGGGGISLGTSSCAILSDAQRTYS